MSSKQLKQIITAGVAITSICIYFYYNHEKDKVKYSISKEQQHVGDGKLMSTTKIVNEDDNGYISIPLIGLGTWDLGVINDKNGFDINIIEKAMSHAIDVGYRLIDCAHDYQNEHLIGDVLQKLFTSNKIKRDELFIVSKLNQNYHSKKHVRKQLFKTLKDLRLDYLDCFIIHWPMSFEFVDFDDNKRGFDEDYDSWNKLLIPGISLQETWRAMEELVDEGYIKTIGVSNMNVQLLYDLLSYARIKPVINQIETHPYHNSFKLIKFCQFVGIKVMAYSPLGTPSNKNDNDPELLKDDTLIEIAKRYNVSPAQVCLKWNIQRGEEEQIIVITKSNNIDRISENKSLMHFTLNQDDMKKINNLNKNLRYLRPEQWDITKNIPIFD